MLQNVHERSFIILPFLLRKHWAAISCTEEYNKTVHLHCVESYENLSQGFVGEGWVAADNEKKPKIFPE